MSSDGLAVSTSLLDDNAIAGRALRPLAVVTGASSGIGFELARCCAAGAYDLMIAADEDLDAACSSLEALGAEVTAVQTDLSTIAGVDRLVAAIGNRPVVALLANAGSGLGHAFLEQDFQAVRRVIDTNITGTLYLIQHLGRGMQDRHNGRILITGSIVGVIPGSFQAVYNASKAFIDSFAVALRNELKDSGVTVTCLMPGLTDTAFFERAEMEDTLIGQAPKDPPAEVARIGFEAMQAGKGDVVAGLKNKIQVALAAVTPSSLLAESQRKLAEPGSGSH